MRCAYCDVVVTEYPANGICVCCGAKLPEPPAQAEAAPVQNVQQIFVSVQPQMVRAPGAPHCPKCHGTQIIPCKRGFSWGLGLLGFFLFPGLGILLGFCGSKKPRLKCTGCNRKWKHL